MKSIITAGLLLGMAHGTAAVAGPYANVENNAAWQDGFQTGVTEVHAGYEFDNGVYVQGGPAFISVDGEEGSTEISAKVGGSVDLSEKLEVYGEVGFLTEDQSLDFEELNFATKVGLTYTF
jgi:hypothetical protein